MMFRRDNTGGSAERGIPLGVVLLAMAVAASLPLFVVTAVGAFEGSAQPTAGDAEATGPAVGAFDDSGPLAAADAGSHQAEFNTNRREIGRGDSALGPYIMYTSTGPEGTCALVELPERSPPGARAFYSDCSGEGDAPVNPAKIVDEDGTVVYGLVPEETASVEIDRATGLDLAATLRQGQRGEGKSFFIASSSGPDVAVTIRAVAADGREIAGKAIARAEAETGSILP